MQNFSPILLEHIRWLDRIIMLKSIGNTEERAKEWKTNSWCYQCDGIPPEEDYLIYNLLVKLRIYENSQTKIGGVCGVCKADTKGYTYDYENQRYYICDVCNCGTKMDTSQIPDNTRYCEYVLSRGMKSEKRCPKKCVGGMATCSTHHKYMHPDDNHKDYDVSEATLIEASKNAYILATDFEFWIALDTPGNVKGSKYCLNYAKINMTSGTVEGMHINYLKSQCKANNMTLNKIGVHIFKTLSVDYKGNLDYNVLEFIRKHHAFVKGLESNRENTNNFCW